MKKLITLIAVAVPSMAFAQAISDASSLTSRLINLGNTFIGLLIAFAVIWIIWNVVMFIVKADSEEDRKKYRAAFLWGIVGLAVILSIWGLVNILTSTFRTNNFTPTTSFPTVPPVQIPPQSY